MGAYPVGGGGGRIRVPTEVSDPSLSKPYDMVGDWNAKKQAELDEMLETLFRSIRQVQEIAQTNISTTAGGDVFGPASAVDSNIVLFDTTTGKLIKDSGVTVASLAPAYIPVVFTLSSAEISALNSVPKQMVPAPGANFTIEPLVLTISVTQSVAFGSAPSWRVRFAGSASDQMTVTTSDLNNNRNKYFRFLTADALWAGANVTAMNNKALQLSLSADPAGGTATAVVTLFYRTTAIAP